ncbi:MAG: LytR family transcriptional regulator [Ruminococcaceae bacterium]|nr:LytR family transcriptional regulator [Oscillospiraceae bacterium]
MSKKQILSYIKNTISITLILCLVCVGVIGAVWSSKVYDTRIKTAKDDPLYIKGYSNVLIVGVDKDGTRTDVIMFAQYDRVNKRISVLQIPRDTYDEDNKIDKKINSSYQTFKDGKVVTDIKGVYRAVEKITGHKIDNYVLIDTKGFRNVIDSMGGVDFKVPQRMQYEDPEQDLYIDLYPGMQHLNGDKAEQLVRFRGYPNADLQRNKVQRDFIFAVIDKVLSPEGLLNIGSIKDAAVSSFKTDLSDSDILSYVDVLTNQEIAKDNIHIFGLEGVAEYRNRVSYFIPNDELNKKNFEKYFVDETAIEKVSEAEMKLKESLTSDDGVDIEEVNYSIKSVSGLDKLMLKVRIIDGSSGEKKIDEITSKITSQGFGNKPMVYKSGLPYDTSRIIVKDTSNRSHYIAQTFNFEKMVVSKEKCGDYDVVIVIGKDYAE